MELTTSNSTDVEGFDDSSVRSVSLGIVDDCNASFDLPLKPKFLQSENFSDLTSEWEPSRPSTPGPSTSKTDKVQPQDTTDTQKNKINVEQLLRSANEMNNYLAQNIEDINNFQVGLLNGGKGLYSSMADDSSAFINGTNMSSTPNFELSDDELEDTTGCTSSIFDRDLLRQQSGLNIPRRKSPLFRHLNASFEMEDSTDFEERNVEAFNFSECNSVTSFDVGGLHIRPPHGEEENREKADFGSEDPLLLGIPDNAEVPYISVDDALANFSETIELLLKLSDDEKCTISKNDVGKKEYANFYMKSKPSLSSVDFLRRIQDKCEYEPAVYLVATFLMDTLFLTRNERNNNALQLKLKLQEKEVHRVIIASVRLSTKLLEDFVHSHEYFSKVCGVSKRLLSKLEISLLVCLCNNELMIGNKKLAAAQLVLNELRASL
ncbi:hypothetical protein SKDZ_07G1260 [Saccharomyces kudriavzevii ZP591]|nr:hypothetical protein SKDZ_07G1260 [Saccharomyces kudriavzevii ZP591]